MDLDNLSELWHYTRDLAGAVDETGKIVLTVCSSETHPDEFYVWLGDADAPYSTIAESASEICVTEDRRGLLDLITGDDSSRRIATIQRTGGWRVGS